MKQKLLFLWVAFAIVFVVVSAISIKKEEYELNKVINDSEIQIEEDQLWVEVSLTEETHKVIVREGNMILKEMPCSGGTDEEPTVLGVYYLENRGEWFYSERFEEGALYWVRFHEQYLFHSVPIDENFKVIEEEKELMGQPASHGCIRLLMEDAKWFYYNVPDDTMVVIHD